VEKNGAGHTHANGVLRTNHTATDDIHATHNEIGIRWRTFRADRPGQPNRHTSEYTAVIVQEPRTTTHFPLANLGLPVVFDQQKTSVDLYTGDGERLRLASPHWLRPDTRTHHMLTFIHTLHPDKAALRATRGTTSTPLTGLDPATTRAVHNAWTTFNGTDSHWRTTKPR
jgi:hypothetical protein